MTPKKNRKSNAMRPVCHWRDHVIQAGCAGLRSRDFVKELEHTRFIAGCDCASRIDLYLSPWPDYQRYLLSCSFISCAEVSDRKEIMDDWDYQPLVSFLLPVHKVNAIHLSGCLASIESQIYTRWELCVADDGSGSDETRKILKSFRAKYPDRVKLVCRDNNIGIARTSQEVFGMASGEFVALLDHDDRLAPEALCEVVSALNVQREADWLYSDYDKISPDGERYFYYFKPAWSPDLLSAYCYALHFSVLRRSLVQAVGGFRSEFEGAQDYDLFLRMAEQTNRVVHIPRILYSWRQSSGSTSLNPASKPYSYESARRALDEAMNRRGEPGFCEYVTGFWAGIYRINRSKFTPVMDVVSLAGVIQGNHEQMELPQNNFRLGLQFARLDGESGGKTLQRALDAASSPYLLVICDDVILISADDLHALVSNLVVSGVAVVAPKIVNSDGCVDHCGLALAPGGRILFPLRGLGGGEPGYGAYGVVTRNVGAVAPLVVSFKVSALREIGGFDVSLEAMGAVLDTCFALREKGFRIVADGGSVAKLRTGSFSLEQAMEPGGVDFRRLVIKWPALFCGGDSFYNRNLREEPADFGVRDERDF